MLSCRRLLVLSTACLWSTAALAADPEWIRLKAPGFDVVSQLDEDDTRRWAVEFDQFIGAMHTLYDVSEVALPPLTIVLFKQSKDFAPYRVVTQSGQAQVAGFFGRIGDWSVIAMSGAGRDAMTRHTIYHEAVHWFSTASSTRAPLWFSEGLAEALATFRAVDGRGRWGEVIDNNVEYLAYFGLMPIEDLLRASQDEALHGNDRYYPQAWAFVHYLMFGNGGAQASKLSEFLRQQQQTDLDTAFTTAFGKSYRDFNGEMRGYLRGGRYGYAEVPLRDRGAEMAVTPASAVEVEFALGRVAAAGGNGALARAHARRVIEVAPESPTGYELEAYSVDRAEEAAFDAALERAIALGSRDALLFVMKAERVIAANRREGSRVDDLLAPDVARVAADLYKRALSIRPRDTVLQGLVVALLNVDAPTDADQMVLNLNRMVFPTNGWLVVGQAAIERTRGSVLQASQLLKQATVAPYTLSNNDRRTVDGLRANWLGEWVSAQLETMISEARFADADALATEQLADETLPTRLRTTLESMRSELPYMERFHEATEAMAAGRRQEALETLTELADDASAPQRTRRMAERVLQRLGARTESAE